MKPVIKVGILGFGIVGCGAYKILQENQRGIQLKVGSKLEVTKIADIDPDRERPVKYDKSILTTDANEVVNDPEIDIIVETIGGLKAKDLLLQAIRNGKHIVSANKELIAKEGHQLLIEAGERHQDFFFEASVGGGIPIIRPLKICLAANEITEIKGIVNGTTNYILTKMSEHGLDYADVLKEAQAAGYAEANPTNDVDGHDAAYKISILASIGFNSRVDVNQVYREGITKITNVDLAFAKELGYVVKLLAIAKQIDGAMQVRVHPAFVPRKHPLANVNGVFNGIYVKGNAVGNVMFYGPGAGSLAAGSAVMGDVIDIARNINYGSTGRIACTCFEERPVVGMDEVKCKNYIRMQAEDKPRVLATIANVFGDNNVSIETVSQKVIEGGKAEIVWITHETAEPDLRKSLETLKSIKVVDEVSSWIRVEE